MGRLNINLDEKTHKEFKAYCFSNETDMSTAVKYFIKRILEEDNKK